MSEVALPRRVVMIGANYWPEESGSAPYTTGLAEDLVAHGVDVTVLCAMPHYPGWRIREGYRGRLRAREIRAGVRLVRSWLWVPSRQSAFQRAFFEGSFLSGALALGWRIRRPDVVIASTPSLSGAVAARCLARRWRVPYGLVVQDLVGPGAEQSGMRGGDRVAGVVSRVERWALSGASRVAVVSAGFMPYLRESGVEADRVEHTPNWSHIPRSEADPVEVRRRFGLPEGVPVVLHAGAMGLKQGLEQVVDVARLDDERGASLCFVFVGDGSQRKSLEEQARGLGNVVFLPQQPADAYADLLVAADVLLISERPGMVNMSLPGKLTSYVSAGRPIVAMVSPGGATAAELERSGVGSVVPAGEPLALLDVVSTRPSGDTEPSEARRAYEGSLGRERCLERLRGLVAAAGRGGS